MNEIFYPAPPKANKYSILTVIELGPPVSESSTRITYFMPPLLDHLGESNWSPVIGNP